MDRPQDFTPSRFEGFDGAFDEIRFKGESSERFKGLGVGEEVQKSHIEDPVVVVIPGLKRVVGDDELLEGVAGVSEREGLLCRLQSVFNCIHSCRYFNTRIVYHTWRNNATAHIFHFPRHILCSKHEYIMESMKTKDTEVASNDESFDFHLDPNRVRTNAEIQLFADVFSISFDEARQILKRQAGNVSRNFSNAKRTVPSFLRA